jgi:hypothetical protein
MGDVCHLESSCLSAPQRNRRAVYSKLERVAAERRAQKRDLRAFDEAQDHQPLHGDVLCVDVLDTRTLAGFQIAQRQR